MTKQELINDVNIFSDAFYAVYNACNDYALQDYYSDFCRFKACTITDNEHYIDDDDSRRIFILAMFTYLFTLCETYDNCMRVNLDIMQELTESGKIIVALCDKYETLLVKNLNL